MNSIVICAKVHQNTLLREDRKSASFGNVVLFCEYQVTRQFLKQNDPHNY